MYDYNPGLPVKVVLALEQHRPGKRLRGGTVHVLSRKVLTVADTPEEVAGYMRAIELLDMDPNGGA